MSKPRVGLVGPARTRIGLGPYLARDLETVGAHLAAVAGRDPARTRAAADELAGQFGHEVAAYTSLPEMLRADPPLDGVVIAAPIEVHKPALEVALEARIPVLCEKPLVAPEEHDQVPALVEAFVGQGLLLMENCIWPYTLPAVWELHPELVGQPLQSFEMRLSPVGRGVHMVVDSLSHFISMLQALLPVDASTRVAHVEIRGAAPDAEAVEIDLRLESPFPAVQSTLYLERVETQPRPAWVAVSGKRVDRHIGSDYSISFAAGGRSLTLEDPLAALVRVFVQLLREPNLDRARAESFAIRERARIYDAVLGFWGQ